jgi:methylglutaconyl-CoA hydratase
MIKFEIKDQIGILTLNRPEKRNALHPELVQQMKSKLIEVQKSQLVKVLIITGEGKAFCAGADLEYLKKLKSYSSVENEKDSRGLAELFLMLYNFPKPVIAAVNGAALAGGCGLASVCDFIVADKINATFGYPEVKIGFIAAVVSTFLIRRVGEGLAKHLLLSGEMIEADRAYEIGFVNYLNSNALELSLELASKLKNNSITSMEMTKKMIRTISGLTVEEAVEFCIGLNAISRTTEDFKNGLDNFLNKK